MRPVTAATGSVARLRGALARFLATARELNPRERLRAAQALLAAAGTVLAIDHEREIAEAERRLAPPPRPPRPVIDRYLEDLYAEARASARSGD